MVTTRNSLFWDETSLLGQKIEKIDLVRRRLVTSRDTCQNNIISTILYYTGPSIIICK